MIFDHLAGIAARAPGSSGLRQDGRFQSYGELVEQVAAQAGTDKTTAAAVLKGFEETVTALVAKGDKVALTGFLTFEQRARAATTARNPQSGETVKVKAKKVPRVTIGASFKKVVNKEAPAAKLAKV